MGKPTLVLGASLNPERYSHLAVRRLSSNGHAVIAVGRREGMIGDVQVRTAIPEDLALGTVTLYLNAANQQPWHAAILALRPERVIFNPGAEDDAFERELRASGIEVVEGCTLVMLSAGSY